MTRYFRIRCFFIIALVSLFIQVSAEVNWNDNKSCKECHPDIYKEWETTRHANAWTSKDFATQSQKHTKEECLACHAPKPLFETGIGKEAVVRAENRDDGVNCISCHRQNDKAMGPFKDAKGGCNPAFTDVFEENKMCDMCHIAAGKEWKTSSYSKKTNKNYSTCATCHMKTEKRPAAKDGKVREVFRHITYGSHDLKSLQEAVRNLSVKVTAGKAVVTLPNDLTGHSLPTGTPGRTLLIMTAIKNDDGKTIAMHREEYKKGGSADGSQKAGSAEKITDTSIPPDKTITLSYDTTLEEGEVVVKVLYKHNPSEKDSKATEVTEKRVSF